MEIDNVSKLKMNDCITMETKLFEKILEMYEEAMALEEYHEDWEAKWKDIDKWLEKGQAILAEHRRKKQSGT